MENLEKNTDSTIDYQNNLGNLNLMPVVLNTRSYNQRSSQFDGLVTPKPIANIISAPNSNINLKTCDFDDLLNNLSNRKIFENISAVYYFLKGKNEELEFRGADKYVEEILVRIIQNVDVLQSPKLMVYGPLMRFCNLIIDILKHGISNRTFMVDCVYKTENDYIQGRVVNNKILVYRKLYYESQMQMPEEMTSIMSMSSTPPISRSMSKDSLDSQTSNSDTILPSANRFILHCLNLMLDFVKDETQTSLELSGLDQNDAYFFHSVFSSVIDENFDNGVQGKKVCRELWEAVRIRSMKFDFRIRNLKSSLDIKSLLLEKRTKMDESDSTGVPDGKRSRRENKRKLPKIAHKHQCLLNTLSPAFIMRSLNQLLNFLSDDSEASVIIPVKTPKEKKFVNQIVNYCRSLKIRSIFDDEPKRILEELNDLLNKKTNFKVKMSGNYKVHNDVKFTKVPVFDNPPQQNNRPCDDYSTKMSVFDNPTQQNSRSWYPRVETVSKDGMSGFKRKELLQTVPGFGQRAPRSNINFQYAGFMNLMPNDEKSTKDPVLTEMMIKYSTPNKLLQPTDKDQQESSTTIEMQSTTQPSVDKQPKVRGKDGRSNQLIEALSVPVQIDKAVKMMVGMGWKGGALGARGNGITEPIMPQLNRVYGAGLGHNQPKPPPAHTSIHTAQASPSIKVFGGGLGHIQLKSLPVHTALVTQGIKVHKAVSTTYASGNRSPQKFREIILTLLLDLLTSDQDSRTGCFTPKLTKKENTFVGNAIRAFGERQKFKLEGSMQTLVDEIEEQYQKQPEMSVTASTSSNGKQILFKKIAFLRPLPRTETTRNDKIAIADTMTDDIDKFINNYGPLFHTQETLQVMKFRVRYLLQILKLVKDKTLDHIVVDFDEPLTTAQKQLLLKRITRINQKVPRFPGNSPEAILCLVISEYMDHSYKLTGEFNKEQTSVTITKKNVPKRLGKGKGSNYICEENNDKDNENDNDIGDNDDKIKDNFKMSETEDNVSKDNKKKKEINVANRDNTTEKQSKRAEKEIETDNVNTQSRHNIVTIGNSDSTKKVESTNNTMNMDVNEKDELVKTENTEEVIDDDNDNNLITSSIYAYSTDDMSVSDQSGYTANLDYNETVGSEDDKCDVKISDEKLKNSDKYDKLECDKSLDVSLKSVTSKTALTVDIYEQSPTEDKSDVKIVYLTKNDAFSKDMPKCIQGLITLNIIKTKELPLLECHGVQNNALIYSCHTKKSFDWLENLCIENNITILTKEFDKMSLKINTFSDFDEKSLFDLIELYNKVISTKEWCVFKKEKMVDCVIFEVKMDAKSVKFILDSKLSLYAGVDKITFSIIWE